MIEETINIWNNNIDNSLEGISKSIYGLAIPIVEKLDDELFYPAVVNDKGECSYVFVDDESKFGVYHKLMNIDYSSQSAKGYGDGEQIQAKANLMIVFAISVQY